MKSIKRFAMIALILAILAFSFAGCEQPDTGDGSDTKAPPLQEQTNPTPDSTPGSEAEDSSSKPADDPVEPVEPVDPTVTITLNGSSYTVSKSGVVTADGNVLTITAGGVYKLVGTLDNAQIRIAVEKTEIVDLIFAGVSITNKTSAPLYIDSADKVSIELAAGTENFLSDAKTYIFPEGTDKPNACIYSSEDLTIKGEGALTVKAYYNNGIGTKNDLKIKGGNITVEAANNALKGNQSVKIEGGNLTIKGADGIKSDSLLEGEGIIEILGGTLNITAGDDGIQAVTNITIAEGASVTINAADKDVNSDGTTNIADGALISK